MERPEWWNWELGFVSHLEDRMEERGFSETELRAMLDDATAVAAARRPGRWLISTRLGREPWVVVVEPDAEEQIVYVVTAYRRGRTL